MPQFGRKGFAAIRAGLITEEPLGGHGPEQLENKKKRLIQEQKEQEHKDRTNRLCKRMGLFEKLLPDTIPLTEEQFKTFLDKTVMTDHARRVLDELTAQNAATAPAQGAGTAARGNHPARY